MRAPSILILTMMFTQTALCQTAEEWISKGNEFLKAENDEAAIDAFSNAIVAEPNNPKGYEKRAQVRLKNGPYTDAIRDLNRCIDLDPARKTEYVFNRGIARRYMGRYDEAERDFNYCIDTSPKNIYFQSRGSLYMQTNEFQRALDDFEQSLELKPSIYSHVAKCEAKLALGLPVKEDLDTALLEVDKILADRPGTGTYLLYRAKVYFMLGRVDEAMRDFDIGLQKSPFAIWYQTRGRAYKKLGENYKAWEDFKKANQLDPYDDSIKNDLAEVEKLILRQQTNPAPNNAALTKKSSLTGKRVALIIGNKNYANVPPLGNTQNDAMDMVSTLRQKGFQVISLYNAKNKAELRDAVIKFNTALQGSDGGVGLFYYSGHGLQIDGENYIVPVNAKLAIKSDVDDQCLKVDYVLRAMEVSSNKLSIIILDACRNNPFRGFSRTGEVGLTPIDAPKGSYLVFATKPGSVASDGNGRNGLFTSKLLKYINEPDLSLEQVFKKVAADVSKESGDRQRPWISSDFTDDFYF
jgi:tetratricopeptide (TPR) repeat protein